jgi:hypothetical protein
MITALAIDGLGDDNKTLLFFSLLARYKVTRYSKGKVSVISDLLVAHPVAAVVFVVIWVMPL